MYTYILYIIWGKDRKTKSYDHHNSSHCLDFLHPIPLNILLVQSFHRFYSYYTIINVANVTFNHCIKIVT